MKRLFSVVFVMAFYFIGYSQSILIEGRIIDENLMPVSDACVMVYSQDSTLVSSGFSNSLGVFKFQTDSNRSNKIKISCLGYETIWTASPISGDIKLSTNSQLLSEVEVKGNRNFTKQTDTGFIYDLSTIKFVKDYSILQVLKVVPFIDIDSDGNIRVNGDKRYAICLNGKPFDMAMSNPSQILQSLRAKDIKKIEIITLPDSRFGNGVPVINIITSANTLNGIYFNGMINYQTTPNIKTSASLLAKKKHIDFSLSYNYDYQNQHNQPIYQSITTNNNSTILCGGGDGNWHTHILRALASWNMDTLNVVYADIHAKINRDYYLTQWTEQKEGFNNTGYDYVKRNQSSATKGTLETNIIYRNYFRNNSKQEHFMLGYRYTYNPDKRNYSLENPLSSPDLIIQKTNGGINEHTVHFYTIMPVSHLHQLKFGAKEIYREADINSSDNSSLSYSQNIFCPYLNYIGSFKWFNAAVDLSCEYEYLSISNLKESKVNRKSKSLYLMPFVSLYRSINNWKINIVYLRSLQRPSIVMMNPFFNSENSHFHQVGNPNLKAEIKDDITISASYFKKRVSLYWGVTYAHTDNTILHYQKATSDLGTVISTYDNIGKLNTLTGNIFANWQPIAPLVLKLNINGGLYNLKSARLNLSQKDYILNVFGWIDYYLPNNWNVGANVMHFKQTPEPFGKINSITNYSIHLGKTWLNGALSANLVIASPLSKYSKLKTIVSNPDFSTIKVNYMTARYVGFDISYTFRRGEGSTLKRDSSLKNLDYNSGVQ